MRSPHPYLALLLALAACSSGEGATPPASTGGGGQSAGGKSSDGGAPPAGSDAGGKSSSGGAPPAGSDHGGKPSGGQPSSGGAQSPGGTTTDPGPGGSPPSTSIDCRAKGDGKSTITLVNRCQAELEFRGTGIAGGALGPGEHACRDVGDVDTEIPAIRFWGFIGPDPGGERYTLAELTLNTAFNDFDWYNISHVDAHNLPMQVAPSGDEACRVLTCATSLLDGCPAEGQLKDAEGKLISCFSPLRDDPNSAVAQYFEASCADAYSWSGDDQESVVACAGEDYDVVFCP